MVVRSALASRCSGSHLVRQTLNPKRTADLSLGHEKEEGCRVTPMPNIRGLKWPESLE